MRTALLALVLMSCLPEGRRQEGCNDPESRYDYEMRQQIRVLDDRTRLLQEKLSELDRCLTNKMTMAETAWELRVSIQTCAAVMRNVKGLTP